MNVPSLPKADELEGYHVAGASWVLMTGWINQLDELVGQLHPGDR